MADDDLQSLLPRLQPAPLVPRALAGALDLFVLGVLWLALVLVPVFFGGMMLPVLSAFAAIVMYAVIPLTVFHATLGMRVAGVELVGRDGQPPDPMEVLFREIMGRGLGPMAALSAVLIGFIGALLGRVDLQSSGAVTGLMFLVCMLLAGGAALGHFVALAHPERRSLADLIGGTMVVPRATSAKAVLDADEQEMARARWRRSLRNGAIAEGVLLALALFVPWRLAQRSTGKQEYAQRQELVALEHHLLERPTDARLAAEAAALADATGQPDRADAIRKKHREAVLAVENHRVESLRSTLAQRPDDEEARDALVELLETRGERDEARKVREAGFVREGTAEAQAEWGAWLFSREYTRDAVAHLRDALDGGFDDPEVHAYLGRSLLKLEQKAEARLELKQALAADPDGESDLQDDIAEIDKELGPLPPPPPPEPVKPTKPVKKGR